MFSSLWQRYKNLTRLQNQRFCTGPENLVTRKLVMRTYLAIRKAEPRRSGVKSPRLNDSSNPLFLFQRKKRAQLCSLSSWQRYKNLNASVQNLVTRFARNENLPCNTQGRTSAFGRKKPSAKRFFESFISFEKEK